MHTMSFYIQLCGCAYLQSSARSVLEVHMLVLAISWVYSRAKSVTLTTCKGGCRCILYHAELRSCGLGSSRLIISQGASSFYPYISELGSARLVPRPRV